MFAKFYRTLSPYLLTLRRVNPSFLSFAKKRRKKEDIPKPTRSKKFFLFPFFFFPLFLLLLFTATLFLPNPHPNTTFPSPQFDMTDTGATDFHCLAIVAPDPSSTSDENSNLYFTVVYEWNERSIQAGSKAHQDWAASHVRPEELVESAIRITRRLVGEGKL